MSKQATLERVNKKKASDASMPDEIDNRSKGSQKGSIKNRPPPDVSRTDSDDIYNRAMAAQQPQEAERQPITPEEAAELDRVKNNATDPLNRLYEKKKKTK